MWGDMQWLFSVEVILETVLPLYTEGVPSQGWGGRQSVAAIYVKYGGHKVWGGYLSSDKCNLWLVWLLGAGAHL